MNMTLFTKIIYLKSGWQNQQRNKFEIVHYHYPARHTKNKFIKTKLFLKTIKFAISSHGPPTWNNVIDKDTKTITSIPPFKRRLKKYLFYPREKQK